MGRWGESPRTLIGSIFYFFHFFLHRLVSNINVIPLADPHAFTRHFSLINREDLQKALRAEVFVNEADNQVRAAHQILKYDPAHKSFAAPKYVIRAKDPRLRKITVTEDGFRFPEEPSISEGVTPAGPSSSFLGLSELAKVGLEREEEVADFGPAEDEFDVSEQVHQSEVAPGDSGDPCLTEADFSASKFSPRHEMGYKKRPQPSLSDLIEGQPGKSKPEIPPTKTRPAQGRSASTYSRLPPSPSKTSLPPRHEPSDPKQKKDKGKRSAEERSGSPREGDDTRRQPKQLKIGSQGQEQQADAQPEPQAWLPSLTLHGEPLREDSSLRDFREGEGAYVADALERCLLLPADMAELGTMRSREVFLCLKRYLGMVNAPTLMTFPVLVLSPPFLGLADRVLVSLGRPFRPLIGWRTWLMTRRRPRAWSVRNSWRPHGSLKIPRLILPRPGKS